MTLGQVQVEDKRLQAERAGQASAHAGNSAADSAPPPAAPSAGAGMQYVAAPAPCATRCWRV